MNNHEAKSDYNYGIQLLRIVATIWIILFHFVNKGIVDLNNAKMSLGYILLAFCNIGGGVGNCIFLLITGYFSWNGRKQKSKAIFSIWSQVILYSILTYLFLIAIGIEQYNLYDLLSSLFPIISNKYWYASCYIVLMVLSLFIDKLLNAIDERTHFYLLSVCIGFFSVLPTLQIKWIAGGEYANIYCIVYSGILFA